MILRIGLFLIVAAVVGGGPACVSVDTPDTNVKVGLTSVNLPGSEPNDEAAAPYARSLRRVTRQQAEVAEQFAKRDWTELTEESSDLVSYARELSGYAATTHDPAMFRACCEQIVRNGEALRQAALRHDAAAANQALAACDPPINQLAQNFPLTWAPRHTTYASPPPAAPPPAQPSSPAPPAGNRTSAPQRPLVP